MDQRPGWPVPTVAAGAGLRESKKRQTRADLQRSALRLVRERGFDGVSVDEIAAAANVSKRTFFNYFPSKEAAVVDPGPERISGIRAVLLARPAGESPLVALRATMLATAVAEAELLSRVYRLAEEHPAMLQRLRLGDVWMESAIAEAVAARTGLDPGRSLLPALVGAASTVALRTALGFWHPDLGADRFAALLNEAFDLLSGGLAPGGG